MKLLSLAPVFFSVAAVANTPQFEFTPFSSTAVFLSEDGQNEGKLWFPFMAHPNTGKAQILKALPIGVVFCSDNKSEKFKYIKLKNGREDITHFDTHNLGNGCTQINGLKFTEKGTYTGAITTSENVYPLSLEIRGALYYPGLNLDFAFAGNSSAS